MYKTLKTEDYKRILGLPDNYRVDGFLSCGHWDTEKKLAVLKKGLINNGVDCQINRLSGFLQNIFEIKTEGLVYWFSVVYGGAILGEYLHFACLFGSKKNIHVGSCGGLFDPDRVIWK